MIRAYGFYYLDSLKQNRHRAEAFTRYLGMLCELHLGIKITLAVRKTSEIMGDQLKVCNFYLY